MEVGFFFCFFVFLFFLNFRPCYGYALSSRFSSLSNDSQSLDIDLSNEESKRRLFNRFHSGISLFFSAFLPFSIEYVPPFFFYDRVDMLICFAFQFMCRLLYRSKQRGFLELDLVLGKWVEENIHSLDENRIKALIHVLDMVFSVILIFFINNIMDEFISLYLA